MKDERVAEFEEFSAADGDLFSAPADAGSFFVDRVCRRNSDVRTFFDAAADGGVTDDAVVDEIKLKRLPRLRTMSG